MGRNIIISMITCLSLLFSGFIFNTDEAAGAAKQIVTAEKAKNAPTRLGDPAWQTVKAVQVPFEGKERFSGKKATVTTRALYFDDSIYFGSTGKMPRKV